MRTLDVMGVYNKIKEISHRNKERNNPVSIDSLAHELNSNKEMIQQYVVALSILEFIQLTDNGAMVLLK